LNKYGTDLDMAAHLFGACALFRTAAQHVERLRYFFGPKAGVVLLPAMLFAYSD
jgi:hypothetical protein